MGVAQGALEDFAKTRVAVEVGEAGLLAGGERDLVAADGADTLGRLHGYGGDREVEVWVWIWGRKM